MTTLEPLVLGPSFPMLSNGRKQVSLSQCFQGIQTDPLRTIVSKFQEEKLNLNSLWENQS